jgi:hypothetical protein
VLRTSESSTVQMAIGDLSLAVGVGMFPLPLLWARCE